jgi:membrane protease YdiL (CAAX protease family)
MEAQPDDLKPRQWGPLVALFFGAIAFVGSQFLVAEIFAMILPGRSLSTSTQFYEYGLSSLCTLAVLSVFLRQRYNASLKSLGLGQFNVAYIGYALVGVPIYLIISGILTGIAASLVPHFNVDQQQDLGFSHVHGAPELIMVFISLVIVPPLVEELLFRGFIFKGFLKNFGPIVSGLVTSIIFGAAHGQWNVGVDVFGLSLVLCFMAYKTQSLWPSIMLHSTKNFIAYFFVFIMTPSELQLWLLQHLHI